MAHTDLKLRPEFWEKGCGIEIKQALVDYLFTHTTCGGVRATSNQMKLASVKIQEAVGGRELVKDVTAFRACEGVHN